MAGNGSTADEQELREALRLSMEVDSTGIQSNSTIRASHRERFAQGRGETVGAESLQARVSLLPRRRDWNAVFNKGAAP